MPARKRSVPSTDPGGRSPGALLERFRADLSLIDEMAPGLLRLPGAVAVSGGPDSMALMWLMRQVHGHDFHIVSVDHALRPESADEVARVAVEAKALGLKHSILRLDWPSGGPTANIQSDARTARYAAIETWAEQLGLGWIMTAHHADDQAETMVMRLVRGSGLAGLSGIRRLRRSGPVMLARPLLDWRKEELQLVCDQVGIFSIYDPSNADPRHDRTRVRDMLRQPGMPDVSGLAATAGRLADAQEALDWAANEAVRTRVRWIGDDVCSFDSDGLPDELVRRAMVTIIAKMGADVRGQAAHRAMLAVRRGETVSLGNVRIRPGETWSFQAVHANSSRKGI